MKLFVILAVLAVVEARRIYDSDKTNWYENEGQPGITMRINQNGLNHIRKVVINSVNKALPTLTGLRAEKEFGDSAVLLHDLKVTGYKPPKYTLIKPSHNNTFVIGVEDVDISLKGGFVGTKAPHKLPGDLSGTVTGMTMAITMNVTMKADGTILITPKKCKAVVKTNTLNVIPKGPLAPFVQPQMKQINDGVKAAFPILICGIMEGIAADAAKGLTKGQLVQDLGAQKVEAGPATGLVAGIMKDLLFDNTMQSDPIVTYDYMEMYIKGDVRYKGKPTSPFYPRRMSPIRAGKKMLYSQVSDTVLNRFMYQAYVNDKFDVQLYRNTTPEFLQSFMRTDCDATSASASKQSSRSILESFCFGSLLPGLRDEHPQATVELVILPHGVPTMKLDNGKASGVARARMLVYVIDDATPEKRKQALVVDTTTEIEATFKPSGKKLFGKIAFPLMKARVHRSALQNVSSKNIQELAELVRTIITPELNNALTSGFDYPHNTAYTLVDPEIKFDGGLMKFSTDFELDQPTLDTQIMEQIAKAI